MTDPEQQSDQEKPAENLGQAPAPASPEKVPPANADPGAEEMAAYTIEERPSLLDASAHTDACPNCHAPLPDPAAVVCLKCGYDLVANKVHKTNVGEVEVAEETSAGEFVRPGRLGWRAPTLIGGGALVAAAVLSGVYAPGRPIGHSAATLLFGPVNIGIGVAAVAITARLMQQRLGRIELAGARMLLAVGLMTLLFYIGQALNAPSAVRFLAGAGLGAGLYYLVVWWSFSLNRTVAMLLSLLHLSMWIIFLGLLQLNAWLATPTPAS